jgi:hypothetical protein
MGSDPRTLFCWFRNTDPAVVMMIIAQDFDLLTRVTLGSSPAERRLLSADAPDGPRRSAPLPIGDKRFRAGGYFHTLAFGNGARIPLTADDV